MITNIEDCLEILAGLRAVDQEFIIEKPDHTIVTSIARQVFKGTALTDRQYNLMKEKLVAYSNQFAAAGYTEFENALSQTRQSLRSIDRRKYIKIVNNTIEVRFPFNKSTISLIHEFSNTAPGYHHIKGSHVHSYEYTETNVLNLLDRFLQKEFEIDEQLLEDYKKIKYISENKQDFLSGIFDNQLRNIHVNLEPVIQNDLGNLSSSNYIHFVDRRFKYGLEVTLIKEPSTLTERVSNRHGAEYQSKPSKETLASILGTLQELDRFPILVVLDPAEAERQLHETANYFRDIVEASQQSVLFREDGTDSGFNQLIHDRKLNNWVDADTKIVYINKGKLPKLLLKTEWTPSAAFSFTSAMDRFVNNYIGFNCDLIVYREENMSPFRRYSNYYG